MAKWEARSWGDGQDGGASLMKDGTVVAGVSGIKNSTEIARKLNAFDEMLAALRLAENAMVRNNSPFDVDAWVRAVDSVSSALVNAEAANV